MRGAPPRAAPTSDSLCGCGVGSANSNQPQAARRPLSAEAGPPVAPRSATGLPEPLRHRLRRRLPAWRSAGASPQVLEWIRDGASCQWIDGPPPPYNYGVSLSKMTLEQSAFLEDVVTKHYATGAWEDAPLDERTHICRVHLVPKKGAVKWRVVVDLRPTNRYCISQRCRYETLKVLSRLAARGCWAFSWDMKDGYHQVGIRKDHRRYMTFALPPSPTDPTGQPRYVRSAALPFGWSASPLIFTKVMRVMVRVLRAPMAPTLERVRRRTAAGRSYVLRLHRGFGTPGPRTYGMRVLPYVDDFLALARTRREALLCRARAAQVMQTLGVTRHPEKGSWEPTQRLEHLGLDIDFVEGMFRVPPHKLKGLMQLARSMGASAVRGARNIPARVVAGFIGYAQSVYLACPQARFYLRALHDDLATRSSWEGSVRLSRQSLRDLRWWAQIGSADVSRAIWRSPVDQTLHCDASHLGWGGVLNGTVPAHGMWTGRARGRHINFLELLAVHKTLQANLERLRGRSVLLWEDNMTVVHVLSNRTTRSPELMHLLRKVWFLLDSAGIQLSVRYIASGDNVLADALSRGSPMDELELRLPAWQDIEQRWGPHTVDRYASLGNAQLARFNSLLPCEASDGAGALSQRWAGENNYAFPPVSELPRLAQLLFERPSLLATVVTPYWPTQAWFQQLTALALHVEVQPALRVAAAPAWLPASGRHALSGAMLAYFRVGAPPATRIIA